jgi:molybdate transport system regulatory protein
MNSDEKRWHGPVFNVNLRLWIGGGNSIFFGPGRAELLNAIERHGSLRKAAHELNMSYRGAWGKLKRTEEALGIKLVEKTASNKEGYRLTEAGRELKEKYDRWVREVQNDAIEKARTIFSLGAVRIEGKSSQATSGK